MNTWNIAGITVSQDGTKKTYWVSGADIDADGSNGQNGQPFAYNRTDTGLDLLRDAGYPSGAWQNVLVPDATTGLPIDDGNGNFYSSTTYAWPGRPISTRYVDAATVPYVVVNPIVRLGSLGVVIGCRALVSYRGATVEAVVADVGPAHKIGEISIAAAIALGIPSSPRTGGVESGVYFQLFPDTPANVNGIVYELQPAF